VDHHAGLLPATVAGVTAIVAVMGIASWHARRRGWRLTPGPAADGFLAPPPRLAEPLEPAGTLTCSGPVAEPAEREQGAGLESCQGRVSAPGAIADVASKPVDLGDLLAMWPAVQTVAHTDGTDSEELSRLLFPDHPPVDAAGRP
jgi:hypothetical protein